MPITVIIEADVKNFENWLALFNELKRPKTRSGY